MTQWIGAIILLAAAAFVVFAFRQGAALSRINGPTIRLSGMAVGGTAPERRRPPTEAA